MYIKQLEIDNFKSFANKVDIPMLKGFTTISGPNGSGKSNIIDSILFALGLSTSRTLRAEKISQLISTYNKRNEAFVKVTFGETEEGDFSVARRIRKSSQGYNSIYYLDDKIATLSEVHTILEKYNITPNSYNVMMQGDVMSITNCTPGERRKIIDEIAGVADFDRRIEQATGELETVEKKIDSERKEENSFYIARKLLKISEEYKEKQTVNYLKKISNLAVKKFEEINKKNDYITKIMINKDSYEISLFDIKGIEKDITILSAGEKQLLISAIVWSVFKLADRNNVFIFDTPLARLDKENRALFVEKVLCTISNQVLILSTDEEIVGDLYNIVKSHINRSYMLINDVQEGKTVIKEAYFE